MHELATIPKSAPVAPIAAPALANKIATFDGMEIVRGQVPAHVVSEAKAHLAMLEVYHAPPPIELIELWACKLRNGVATITDREFEGRLEAIQETCGGLPGWAWNMETLRLAWQHFKFFPTASEVHDLIGAVANKAMLGVAHVRLLASAKPAPDEGEAKALPPGLMQSIATSLIVAGR